MKIVIAGANGQLGTELQRQYKEKGCALGALPAVFEKAELACFDIDTLSITDKAALEAYIGKEQPDIVINCSAYTNVDGCETDPATAFAVNAVGARNLAIACEKIGAKLLHISTDYVFSGTGTAPFNEYDMPAPKSVYGKTKWAGEEYVKQFCKKSFIVRTAWLYGFAGANFVKTILKAGAERKELQVVNDQFGNPTNAEDLAYHLWLLAESEEYGTYHCTGEGVCSWYDFAAEILRLGGVAATLNPCTTDEYPRPAKRPAYSALENGMLVQTVGNKMRPWQVALSAFFDKYLEATR